MGKGLAQQGGHSHPLSDKPQELDKRVPCSIQPLGFYIYKMGIIMTSSATKADI